MKFHQISLQQAAIILALGKSQQCEMESLPEYVMAMLTWQMQNFLFIKKYTKPIAIKAVTILCVMS